MMSGVGLCDICGKQGILYSCSLCGKRVCGDCVSVRGVCKTCLSGRQITP